MSECSTNTEDYVTCTDASKRGTKPPSASSSSTAQVPGSNSMWIRCVCFVVLVCSMFRLCRCDGLLLLHIFSNHSDLFQIVSFMVWSFRFHIFFVAFIRAYCFLFLPGKYAPISKRSSIIWFLLIVVATPSSQTLTQDGSSFESASSMYSLARVDAISDDGPLTAAPAEDTLPLPPPPSTKPSPSHSISSSSSGSFCLHGGGAKKPATQPISTSPRNSVVKVPISAIAAKQPKTESISEDEKSEKRYSSSGYYESPHDDGKCSHFISSFSN